MTSIEQAQLKVKYGEFIDPFPDEDMVARDAPFTSATKIGRSYNFPVYVGLPHGQKHNDDHTAFALATVISPVLAEATLAGSEFLLRDNIAYADLFATQSTGSGNNGNAFMSANDFVVLGLMKSGQLYRELDLMYGPGPTSTAASNIGVINASVSGANLGAGQVVNITRATWIPGLWQNMVGAKVDIYQTDGTTVRDTGVTVSAPVEATNRITLTKAASVAVAAATDIILVTGGIDVSMYGIEAICGNSGSLFGISASTYPQWRVQSYSAGSAAMERLDVLSIGSRMHSRGVRKGGKLRVASTTFTDLSEEANELLRTAPDSSDVVTQGASQLVYRTACGPITVESYSLMKQSIGVFTTNGNIKRVGSTDLTFRAPGTDDFFYQQLADNAGCQLRVYFDQAVVIEQPHHAMYVTGIVSTADTTPA